MPGEFGFVGEAEESVPFLKEGGGHFGVVCRCMLGLG